MRSVTLSLAAAGALLALGACSRGGDGAGAETTLVREARAQQVATIDPRRRTPVTDAVARIAPAVVTVQTEVVQSAPVDPFDWLLGRRSGQQVMPGLGSGFITRADGVIVTNAHVVSGATHISVALRDGTTYPARLLGADEPNDIAVLKIDAKSLPVAPLGDSRDLLIGETVI
ncbi:MAG TPA: trypsin-like peptidase domain-containing protein, partial [Gemmatimonadaceae bacterium]|nr:trypsin-like peptidase domain-containing protein [Gemmatimonadaceae bacterium]